MKKMFKEYNAKNGGVLKRICLNMFHWKFNYNYIIIVIINSND